MSFDLSMDTLQLQGSKTLLDLDLASDLVLEVAPDADVRYCAVVGLKQLVKRVHFKLADGARLDVSTVVVGAGEDQLVVDYTLHHMGRGTYAHTLVKGAFVGSANAEVLGLIRIDPTAQQTESFLEQRALLLADAARANLQPKLQIEADDVRASHAATVGQLDAEQVFYAQTRGLPPILAQRIVVQAFLLEAVAGISASFERASLVSDLVTKLGLNR